MCERAADDTQAKRVVVHLATLTAGKGEDFGKLRAELVAKIAETSSVGLPPTPPAERPEPMRRPPRSPGSSPSRMTSRPSSAGGLVADQAALARKLGLTRARVTQLFDLLMLPADLQEQVLALEAVDGGSRWPSGRGGRWPTLARGPSSGRRGRS